MTVPEFFEFPPTRSNRAKWALEELGVDYTSRTIDLRTGEHHSQEYKAIHPLGVVPAYRTDDYTVLESVAIVLQLLDEHPEKGLAPAVGTPERAEYYQWSVFACSEFDPALSDIMQHTMHLPEVQRVTEIAQRGRDRFAARGAMLSAALEGRDYLLGSMYFRGGHCDRLQRQLGSIYRTDRKPSNSRCLLCKAPETCRLPKGVCSLKRLCGEIQKSSAPFGKRGFSR